MVRLQTMLLLLFVVGCSESRSNNNGDIQDTNPVYNDTGATDGDADGDADSDADGDADTDADADSDADGDTDTDGDADTDTDADNDSDTDTDTDTDADADADTDTAADPIATCEYTCSAHCQSIGGFVMTGTCPDDLKCCDIKDTESILGTEGEPNGDSNSDIDSDPDTDNDTDLDTDVDSVRSGGLTIYYIRHAETVANVSDDTDNHELANQFTELGDRQVEDLKSYLIDDLGIVPDKVLVSPTWRAQKTIEPYLVAEGITGEIWPELNECCQGKPSGEEIPTTYDGWKLSIDVAAKNLEFRDADSEEMWYPITYEEGIHMVRLAKNLLLDTYGQSGKTLFVIGHAGAGKILMGMLTGHDMVTDIEDNIYLFNTSVHHVVQDSDTGEFTIVDQNINNPEGSIDFGW